MTLENLTDDQQFHSFALLRCRDHKAIDNDRLLNHFGVRILIESIAKSSNERRADLVQKCTGIKRNSALKMTVDASINMIETALAEKDTSSKEIFDESDGGISTEEIVRFFPLDQVFDLWFHSGFIAAEAKEDKAFMADLYDFINQRKMFGAMTSLQLVQEIGLQHFVSDKCPIEKRTALLEKVLQHGEPMLATARPDASSANAAKAKPFTAANLLEAINPTDLVGFIPLSHLSKPIYALAQTKGWMKSKAELPKGALDTTPPPPAETAPPASEAAKPADDEPVVVAQTEGDPSMDDLDALLDGKDGEKLEGAVVMVDEDEPTRVGKTPFEVPKPPALQSKEKPKQKTGGARS